MGRLRSYSILFCSLAALHLARGQSGYNDDLNLYDDYQLYDAAYQVDMYDGADDGLYYNEYTGDYDEVYGDYFFDDNEGFENDCRIGPDGKAVFNGTRPCDVKIEGVDKLSTGLTGGVDGTYVVESCQNGRPLYLRKDSAPGQARVLWYSAKFRDWDIANGSVPQDNDAEEDILLYGGKSEREKRPQFVEDWSLATDFLKDHTGTEEYSPIDMIMVCADGSKTDKIPEEQKFGKRPFLVDDEMEEQYKRVYQRAKLRGEANAELNLGLVTMFVMIGLGIVFGLPFLVARSRRLRRARAASAGASVVPDSLRKRGHTN